MEFTVINNYTTITISHREKIYACIFVHSFYMDPPCSVTFLNDTGGCKILNKISTKRNRLSQFVIVW